MKSNRLKHTNAKVITINFFRILALTYYLLGMIYHKRKIYTIF